MTTDARLDPTDARILEVLQRDGRRPYAEIGAEVGMSGPSAHERVKKLEARGIITGYGARLDPASVGLGVLAFLWITQAPGSLASDLSEDFGAIAEKEGYPEVAAAFRSIAKVELEHEKRYRALLENVVTGHVFKKKTTQRWSCRNCGYVHEGTAAPNMCPACQHPQAYFEVKAENY